ncbi:hypothetical protein M011DRAFT_477864 [Sporormia fimetaria CBS 119925]|uniref:Uncharacterized protein n=1 Tax=Sporormia fimetaria CBS 119925 TaxID=1340428 RepID=A0A6A6VBZ7_9PLEO|nr:hypothetical protein M011DRAFT_477864 [Sporormia fimetaria CBS 119925]
MPSRAFFNLQAARKARQEQHNNPTLASTGADQSVNNEVINKSDDTLKSVAKPVDLLTLGPVSRKALDQGGPIFVTQGSNTLSRIPRALFLAASTKGTDIISESKACLPANINTESVMQILKWLKMAVSKNHLYPLRLQDNLTDAIHIYNAAEALGLTKYVQNTVVYHCAGINQHTVNEWTVKTVGEISTADNTFVKKVADVVAYKARNSKFITDEVKAEYLAAVGNYPIISSLVKQINAHHQNIKEKQAIIAAKKKLEYQTREEARHAAYARNQMAAKQTFRPVTPKTRAALIEKLQAKVVTITQEERELIGQLRAKGDPAFLMAGY